MFMIPYQPLEPFARPYGCRRFYGLGSKEASWICGSDSRNYLEGSVNGGLDGSVLWKADGLKDHGAWVKHWKVIGKYEVDYLEGLSEECKYNT
ncbi:hypothetical protein BJX70DRAFT_382198 [Aspergillus crustosus]